MSGAGYCQFEQVPGAVCGADADHSPLGLRCSMHANPYDPPTEVVARNPLCSEQTESPHNGDFRPCSLHAIGDHGLCSDHLAERDYDEKQKALIVQWAAEATARGPALPPPKEGDPINHPPHYARLDPEPIEVIEAWGWDRDAYLSSALKYMSRAGHKDPSREATAIDLRKAIWWLSRKADRLEGKA